MKNIPFLKLSSMALLACISMSAQAARLGKIVVDSAQVHQFPKDDSQSVGTVPKDETLAVSNLPIEGFYKARLKDGTIGWISGNDIFVAPAADAGGAAAAPVPTPAAQAFTPDLGQNYAAPIKRPTPMASARNKKKLQDLSQKPASPGSTRMMVSYGLGFPSYDGLQNNTGNSNNFTAVNLGSRKELAVELQFPMSENWDLSIRVESISSTTTNPVSQGIIGTQTISSSAIPIFLGAVWTPVNSRFRLGFGAYLGAAVIANLKIAQTETSSGTTTTANYSPAEFCGMLNLQASYGLSKHFALLFEGGYRYEKTQGLDGTTDFGGLPPFYVNYSAPFVHGGLEYRF
jgi:hypothetical protein